MAMIGNVRERNVKEDSKGFVTSVKMASSLIELEMRFGFD